LTEERFPLPGSSYKELSRIIQAYGQLKKPGSLSEVAKFASVAQTIVSRNNKFLVAIGVIAGGQKKTPTDDGRALARALQLDITDEVVKGWRRVLTDNEFVDKVLSAVRIRKGMERSSLQAHVAFTAGVPRKPIVMTGAATVVDILLAAQLLVDSEGKLIAGDGQSVAEPFEPQQTEAAPPTQSSGTPPQAFPPVTASIRGVPVQIQIQLQCTPDQLDDLGPKLRRLLDELHSPSESTSR
jgi:hypothetical protein